MKRFFLLSYLLILLFSPTWAQVPTVDPTATYYMTDETGKEETGQIGADTPPLNAPVRIVFNANLSFPCNVLYKWKITSMLKEAESTTVTTDSIIRIGQSYGEYEELEMDFNQSGNYTVQLFAQFYDEGNNFIYEFPEEGEDPKTISFSISESKLEFPNGISPNDDERNDVLKPKDGFKNIVSFHAVVFNRWGKKLYSWDDVHGGWDGKVNGKAVKDGVYFLHVTAKGSDGIDYNIKQAINVISGYNNGENEGGTTEE